MLAILRAGYINTVFSDMFCNIFFRHITEKIFIDNLMSYTRMISFVFHINKAIKRFHVVTFSSDYRRVYREIG